MYNHLINLDFPCLDRTISIDLTHYTQHGTSLITIAPLSPRFHLTYSLCSQSDASLPPLDNPSKWATGGDAPTDRQKGFISQLADSVGADVNPDELTKGEASLKIDELKKKQDQGVEGTDGPRVSLCVSSRRVFFLVLMRSGSMCSLRRRGVTSCLPNCQPMRPAHQAILTSPTPRPGLPVRIALLSFPFSETITKLSPVALFPFRWRPSD
jgi:hypothetical protein